MCLWLFGKKNWVNKSIKEDMEVKKKRWPGRWGVPSYEPSPFIWGCNISGANLNTQYKWDNLLPFPYRTTILFLCVCAHTHVVSFCFPGDEVFVFVFWVCGRVAEGFCVTVWFCLDARVRGCECVGWCGIGGKGQRQLAASCKWYMHEGLVFRNGGWLV